MIRFLDIQRQTTWQKKIQIFITDVGRVIPIEKSSNGWKQYIQARDGMGREEPMVYYWNEDGEEDVLMGAIPATAINDQWYDIIWRKDKERFQCRPAEAVEEPEFEKNVWEEKDLRISKMSCIKSAVALLATFETPGASTVGARKDLVLVLAEQFRKYIYNEE